MEPRTSPYGELEAALGHAVDHALLERALTHRSFAYEHGGLPTNERLEFLGDAVLGLVVTDTLYRGHPDLAEGQLAKLRAAVVNMRALAHVGRSLSLGSYLRLGKGEADIPSLVRAIYIGLDPRLVRAAGFSVLAHLEDLVARGVVVTDGPPSIEGRYRLR